MLTKLHVGQLGPRLARHIVPSRALTSRDVCEMLNAASRALNVLTYRQYHWAYTVKFGVFSRMFQNNTPAWGVGAVAMETFGISMETLISTLWLSR